MVLVMCRSKKKIAVNRFFSSGKTSQDSLQKTFSTALRNRMIIDDASNQVGYLTTLYSDEDTTVRMRVPADRVPAIARSRRAFEPDIARAHMFSHQLDPDVHIALDSSGFGTSGRAPRREAPLTSSV